MADPLWHYIIVRKDLPHGAVLAQSVHAAGESASLLGRDLPNDTRAVVLAAKDQQELMNVCGLLGGAGIKHREVWETDGGLAGQMMAIGVVPCDRETVRPFLAALSVFRFGK